MADKTDYRKQIQKLGTFAPDVAEGLNAALNKLSTSVSRPGRVMDYVFRHLTTYKLSASDSLIYPILPMYEPLYDYGSNVFSNTFRFTFKIPEKRRQSSHGPVVVNPSGFAERTLYMDHLETAKADKDNVIIFPNYEGGEPNHFDRGWVQTSGHKPGEIVIVNKVEKTKTTEVLTVMQKVLEKYHGPIPPSLSVQKFYDTHATVEDLAEIMIGLYKELGLTNQYGSKQENVQIFLNSVKSVHDGNTPETGLRQRDTDSFYGLALYVPGDYLATDSPSERITGGGYLLRLEKIDTSSGTRTYHFRPISRHTMLEDYRHKEFADQPMSQPNLNFQQLRFPDAHPLHNPLDITAYYEFFTDIEKLNQRIRKRNKTSEPASTADWSLTARPTRRINHAESAGNVQNTMRPGTYKPGIKPTQVFSR